jgi:hypothetical protein
MAAADTLSQRFEYEDQAPNQRAPAGSASALGIARGGQTAADRGQAMIDAARTPAVDPRPVPQNLTSPTAAVGAARILGDGGPQPTTVQSPGFRQTGAADIANSAAARMASVAPITVDTARTAIDNVRSAPTVPAAVGQAVRGAALTTGGFVADAATQLGSAAKAVATPVINAVGTAITGDNAPIVGGSSTTPGKPASPGAPGAPGASAPGSSTTSSTTPGASSTPSPNRQALQAGAPAAPPQVVVAPSAGGPQLTGATGTAVEGAPGVQKFQKDGRTLYSNVSGAASNDALMSNKGSVNMGAAATLANSIDSGLAAARRAAVDRGDIASVAASYGGDFNTGAPAAAQGPAATILSGQPFGYRTADQERPQFDTRGLSQRQIARLQVQQQESDQRAATAASQMAVQQQGQQLQAQVTREGQRLQAGTAAAQLASRAPGDQADTRLKTAQAGAAQRLQAAQDAYTNARTPEERAKAAETLRVLAGKDREVPDLYGTTVIPGEVDSLGNKSPSRVAVTDKRTGAITVYGPDGQPVSGKQAQGTPLPADRSQLVKDQVYVNGAGQAAKWDGSRFIPVAQAK